MKAMRLSTSKRPNTRTEKLTARSPGRNFHSRDCTSRTSLTRSALHPSQRAVNQERKERRAECEEDRRDRERLKRWMSQGNSVEDAEHRDENKSFECAKQYQPTKNIRAN